MAFCFLIMVNHFVGGCSFNKNIAFLEVFVNYFSFISLGGLLAGQDAGSNPIASTFSEETVNL